MKTNSTYNKIILLLVAVIILPGLLHAGINSANRLFDKFDFAGAAKAYEKYYKKHPEDVEVAEKIATCYRLMNDWQSAEPWYQIVTNNGGATAENIFYHAQAARANNNWYAANELFRQHYNMTGDFNSFDMIISQEEYDRISTMNDFEVDILMTNAESSDFGPAVYDSTLYFTSNRSNKVFAQEPQDLWNSNNFLQMFMADTSKVMNEGTVDPWDLKKINGRYHDGPVAFHPVTGDMYLTRTNYLKKKATKSEDNTAKLKIYKLTKKENGWSTELTNGVSFNSSEYSVGHVSFNEDGSVMYFASDMPGGEGGTDVWKATYNGSTYSDPVNLGTTVNTSGEEMYPSFKDGMVYFASSGHKGLGGLDMYEHKEGSNIVKNLGAPLNSNYDDFAMFFEPGEAISGYFTSNRPGAGSDDIYKFNKISRPVIFYVYDVMTGEPIEGATLTLSDGETFTTSAEGTVETDIVGEQQGRATYPDYKEDNVEYNVDGYYAKIGLIPEGNMLEILVLDNMTYLPISEATVTLNGTVYTTDKNGYMMVKTEPQMDYTVVGEKELPDPNKMYYPEFARFNTGPLVMGETFSVTIYLQMFERGKQVEITNIYYDLDKFFIRDDAAGELNNLLEVLNAYPSMEISLGSHTDCRMPASYNMRLSENRAKAAMEWLIDRGIDKSRMTYQGFGETQTVNGCDCECDQSSSSIGLQAFRDCEDAQVDKCSDQDHQDNRRTIFMVTNF